eukprot:614582-Pleurochrysis_carterae.AAC.2
MCDQARQQHGLAAYCVQSVCFEKHASGVCGRNCCERTLAVAACGAAAHRRHAARRRATSHRIASSDTVLYTRSSGVAMSESRRRQSRIVHARSKQREERRRGAGGGLCDRVVNSRGEPPQAISNAANEIDFVPSLSSSGQL